MAHSTRPTRSPATLAAGAAALLAALANPAGAASPSSFAESRGYQTCVDAAEQEAHLVKVSADYFIYEHEDARRFYLNGYAFQDGDSVPVKIACDTTRSGHRLLGVSVDGGRYAGRLIEPANVAGN